MERTTSAGGQHDGAGERLDGELRLFGGSDQLEKERRAFWQVGQNGRRFGTFVHVQMAVVSYYVDPSGDG